MKVIMIIAACIGITNASSVFLEGANATRLLNRNAGIPTKVIPNIENEKMFTVVNDTKETKQVYITVKIQDAFGFCNKTFGLIDVYPNSIFSQTRKTLGDEFNSHQSLADGVQLTSIMIQEIKKTGTDCQTITIVEDGFVGGTFHLNS